MQSGQKYLSADIVQCAIARHYEKSHGASVVSIGFAPRWDIKFQDGVTLEVKCDVSAARTLNAAIEFWDTRRNKPTGILESEAAVWLHCIPEGDTLRCFELDRKRLLRLCIECGEVKSGGDFNSSLMKVIPLQEIQRISNCDFVLNEGIHIQKEIT
jgi:hypothetical protein